MLGRFMVSRYSSGPRGVGNDSISWTFLSSWIRLSRFAVSMVPSGLTFSTPTLLLFWYFTLRQEGLVHLRSVGDASRQRGCRLWRGWFLSSQIYKEQEEGLEVTPTDRTSRLINSSCCRSRTTHVLRTTVQFFRFVFYTEGSWHFPWRRSLVHTPRGTLTQVSTFDSNKTRLVPHTNGVSTSRLFGIIPVPVRTEGGRGSGTSNKDHPQNKILSIRYSVLLISPEGWHTTVVLPKPTSEGCTCCSITMIWTMYVRQCPLDTFVVCDLSFVIRGRRVSTKQTLWLWGSLSGRTW